MHERLRVRSDLLMASRVCPYNLDVLRDGTYSVLPVFAVRVTEEHTTTSRSRHSESLMSCLCLANVKVSEDVVDNILEAAQTLLDASEGALDLAPVPGLSVAASTLSTIIGMIKVSQQGFYDEFEFCKDVITANSGQCTSKGRFGPPN